MDAAEEAGREYWSGIEQTMRQAPRSRSNQSRRNTASSSTYPPFPKASSRMADLVIRNTCPVQAWRQYLGDIGAAPNEPDYRHIL